MVYFAIRLAVGKQQGYPILTKQQIVVLLGLPVYGPVAFPFWFYLFQFLRYGAH
ncbi:hypothetical protein HQ590_07780 [bacterium]|nr:hypothetical protein [bacterium]